MHQPLWETVDRRLRSRPDDPHLPIPVFAMVLLRIFEALDFLHSEYHLVYTDLKMDNIAFGLSEDDLVLKQFEREELEEPTPRNEVDN